MAIKDDELELDTAKPSGGGKGKVIVIIVVAMLLTSSIVIGALYFMGAFGTASDSSAKDKDNTEQHVAKEEEPKELVVKPAFYMDMQPAFVVNFEDQTHAAYLQVEMQVMARDKEILDTVAKHMPVIRNNILLILSAQKYEVVKTRKGKEDLQKTLLEAIQKVIAEANPHLGNKEKNTEGKDVAANNIEQVYFTSFIMQ